MEIKVFDIGIMQNFAWLVIGDDKNKTTLQVPPEQLEKLANDIIVVLKKYARAKREIYGAMGKELTLSNDGKSDE